MKLALQSGRSLRRPAWAALLKLRSPALGKRRRRKRLPAKYVWQAIAMGIVMLLACLLGIYLGMNYHHDDDMAPPPTPSQQRGQK